jgi:hypothetical protein
VASEISLPGAMISLGEMDATDVTVRRGSVPDHLCSATSCGADWAMTDSDFLVRIPGVARFLIRGGREITADIHACSDEREAALFMLGTAFGILLHQRGHFVLHASSVEVNGKAVLFCAPSGLGKSTLAAALVREGYPFVNDDVCHVGFDQDGEPVVFPDGRMLKLWADAVQNLSLSENKVEAVRSNAQKFYVLPTCAAQFSARQIAVIYDLREPPPLLSEAIEKPSVAQAAALLRRNAYRTQFVRAMELEERYFVDTVRLLRHVSMFYLTRPSEFAALPLVIRDLEAHWRELELLPPPTGGAQCA